MMNIEFIKWLCDKAEGFEIINRDEVEGVICPDGKSFSLDRGLNLRTWMNTYYPLLLQRAIEGVNRDKVREISSFNDRLYVIKMDKSEGTPFPYNDYESIDQAKEQALKYIWEKEQNNG
jgi:hypothetical protein